MDGPAEPPVLSPVLGLVYHDLVALRKLTRDRGSRTTRAQNELLRKLDSADLTTISRALAWHEFVYGW
jgi:hypothetical protein